MRVGLVVHNEADRLPRWLGHWQGLRPIYAVDQSSEDNSADLLRGAGCTVMDAPHNHFSYPDVNMLFKMNPEGWTLLVDVDEFVAPEMLDKLDELAENAREQYDVRAVWLRRRNWVDGRCIDKLHAQPNDAPGCPGCDWQARMAYGPTIEYSNDRRGHSFPQVKSRWIIADPAEIWIEHRRTLAGLKRANRARRSHVNDQTWQMQERYIKQVEEAVSG